MNVAARAAAVFPPTDDDAARPSPPRGGGGRAVGLGHQFLRAWGGAIVDSARVTRALPWLFAAMVLLEFGQHVIEARTGFFSPDPIVRHAASAQPVRLALGWPKMLATWIATFLAIRCLALGDRWAAVRPSAQAVRRYAWVILFAFVPTALIIHAEPLLALVGADSAGAVMVVRAVSGLALQLAEPALLLWFVDAALGRSAHGPIASARATGWLYPWALALIFVTRLPFNLLNQLLNRWPAGQPAAVLWPLLLADALVVPVMVLSIAAVQLRGARVIAGRRHLSV